MEDTLGYSFDDEPVSKFCYDIDNETLEIHFNGYYNIIRDKYLETPCVWTLHNWDYAKIKIGDDDRRCDLNMHLGIFSLILYMKYNDEMELEMLVNTVDNRYITLFFRNPTLVFI